MRVSAALVVFAVCLVAACSAMQLDTPKRPEPCCCSTPECHWKCREPNCPVTCKPTCHPAKCHIKCEPLKCAKCDVHCPKARCQVKCNKWNCSPDGCTDCKTVCPKDVSAQCKHQNCTFPQVQCKPVCELHCWKDCKKKCPESAGFNRPVCELECRESKCPGTCKATPTPKCKSAKPKCCSCSNKYNLHRAFQLANTACIDGLCKKGKKPAFLEVHAQAQTLGQSPRCCPCAQSEHKHHLKRVTNAPARLQVPDPAMLREAQEKEHQLEELAAVGVQALKNQRVEEEQSLMNSPLYESYHDLSKRELGMDQPQPLIPSPMGRAT